MNGKCGVFIGMSLGVVGALLILLAFFIFRLGEQVEQLRAELGPVVHAAVEQGLERTLSSYEVEVE